jgi:hypothetical protein
MPIMFNDLLRQAGIDPKDVRLLRHQDGRSDRDRTPYRLWLHDPDAFMAYQSRQTVRTAREIGQSPYWAAFIVTPSNDNLFVGLYTVRDLGLISAGHVDSVSVIGEKEDEHHQFALELADELEEFRGKVVIDWGKAFIKWTQKADAQDKVVLELRRKPTDEKFVGFLAFADTLSAVSTLPASWIERFREARGIYLLSCPKTGENYVGSATGQGGFYERWLQHAAKGGDAVRFRTREPSELRVCILEVAGSSMLERDIIHSEYRWIDKLKPALNGHTTLIETARPKVEATVGED